MSTTETLHDDTYTGPRFTYGLTYRPLAYAAVPDGWIIFSDRPNGRFRHGTVDYPRALTEDECAACQLTLVAPLPVHQSPGRWISPSQPGDWWTGAEAENGWTPGDAYYVEADDAE